MFIDTHCHLTDKYVSDTGVDAVLAHAHAAGVNTIICPTADAADIPAALNLAETHDNIFCTIGIHPEYAPIDPDVHLTDAILSHPRVIGVGEIGLDYHMGTQTRDAQIKLFERQIALARRHNLPVAIHTRDAEDDTAAILSAAGAFGVMHCYTSSWNLAKKMLDLGFYFSASGILTFKNADEVRDTFAKIPTDRIVIETDAPYCAPVPHRGKQCEPFMVVETAKVLAAVKGMDIDTLAPILTQNTARLYPKITLK